MPRTWRVIRDQLIAAPLKRGRPGHAARPAARVIRDQLIAAPLKLPLPALSPPGTRRHPRSADRGPIEAPLTRYIQGSGSASHPRSADRGPIEALDILHSSYDAGLVIRGQLTAAPLKRAHGRLGLH